MTPYEEAAAQIREKVKEALVTYGQRRTSPDNPGVERAAEQSLNFFEALLKHHKPTPPFEGRLLKEIAPNKRVLVSQPTYNVSRGEGGYCWFSCEVPIYRSRIRTLFTSRCVRVLRFKELPPDLQHDKLVELITGLADPIIHISEIRKRFPKTLNSMRTNKKFYGISLDDEPPIVEPKKKRGYAWILTDVLYEATRLFEGEVHVHIERKHVTLYDRWFAVRVPRI